jgi:hypothetical protein
MARRKSNPRRSSSRRGGGGGSSPSSLHSGVTSAPGGTAHELLFSSYSFFFGEMITELRLFRKSWWQGVHSRCVSLVEVQRLGTEELLESLTVGIRGPEL